MRTTRNEALDERSMKRLGRAALDAMKVARTYLRDPAAADCSASAPTLAAMRKRRLREAAPSASHRERFHLGRNFESIGLGLMSRIQCVAGKTVASCPASPLPSILAKA